jgi:Adenosine deaminase z-alpha domain
MEVLDRTKLKQKIKKFLQKHPRSPASVIARNIDVTKKHVNPILYKDSDDFVCEGNDLPLWSLVTPEVKKPRENYIQGSAGEGLPGYLGYKAGVHGLSRYKRRELLDRIMTRPLPDFVSAEYMEAWGDINSQERVVRLADHLAYFRNTRYGKVFAQARQDWSDDLDYLKDNFWDGTWSWDYDRD